MSEAMPQLGPGTRLPIISGWSAYPGYNHFWYKDAASNAERLKIYETIQQPNGYFFLLPDDFEKQLDDAEQSVAILCRTNRDTINLNRPCVHITGVRRIQIRVFIGTSPLEGEWITEVKDMLPPDSEEHLTRTRAVFRR